MSNLLVKCASNRKKYKCDPVCFHNSFIPSKPITRASERKFNKTVAKRKCIHPRGRFHDVFNYGHKCDINETQNTDSVCQTWHKYTNVNPIAYQPECDRCRSVEVVRMRILNINQCIPGSTSGPKLALRSVMHRFVFNVVL